MKTEIDVHYLVALENDNKKKEEKINELQDKLNSLSEYTLRRKATEYAEKCFNKMVCDLFKAIGADDAKILGGVSNCMWDISDFGIIDGKMPDVVFEFEANIKEAAKNAYIRIGVDFSKVKDGENA